MKAVEFPLMLFTASLLLFPLSKSITFPLNLSLTKLNCVHTWGFQKPPFFYQHGIVSLVQSAPSQRDAGKRSGSPSVKNANCHFSISPFQNKARRNLESVS